MRSIIHPMSLRIENICSNISISNINTSSTTNTNNNTNNSQSALVGSPSLY